MTQGGFREYYKIMSRTRKKALKNDPYKYDRNIGLELLSNVEYIGNPLALIRAKFHLFKGEVEAWLGQTHNGRYYNEEFDNSYKEYQNLRESYLTSLAMAGTISKDVWRCVTWLQLHNKIEPPKEIQSTNEVSGTIQFTELNEMMQKLEQDKKTTGF